MNELENVEQELSKSLAAVDTPCGCSDKSVAAEENPFAEFASSDTLMSELESALGSLDDGADRVPQLAFNEALEFASLADGGNQGLEDIIAVLEKYPGLKITLSY